MQLSGSKPGRVFSSSQACEDAPRRRGRQVGGPRTTGPANVKPEQSGVLWVLHCGHNASAFFAWPLPPPICACRAPAGDSRSLFDFLWRGRRKLAPIVETLCVCAGCCVLCRSWPKSDFSSRDLEHLALLSIRNRGGIVWFAQGWPRQESAFCSTVEKRKNPARRGSRAGSRYRGSSPPCSLVFQLPVGEAGDAQQAGDHSTANKHARVCRR